jgi:tRNA pseudouridine38-40 synthase
MRVIKLLLSYDGTDFQGWQKQPGRSTVQTSLETVLSQIYNEPIRITGSGRTDSGTHAVGQVAHFIAPKVLSTEHKLMRAMNAMLPDSVVVKGAWEAPTEFHARKSAVRKTYIYRIWNHPTRSALWRQRALWVPHELDLKFLNGLARATHGRQDFKSFQTMGTPVKTTIRRIDAAEWVLRAPGLVEFRICGSGFLKQMVRNLVGTMLHLERNKMDLTDFLNIFEARDRQAAKTTAPAHGLYLYRVEYPADLDNKCRKL